MDTILGPKTLIPISFVAIVAASVMWFSKIEAKCENSLSDVAEIKTERKLFFEKLDDINKRLSNIEGYLKNDRFKSADQK